MTLAGTRHSIEIGGSTWFDEVRQSHKLAVRRYSCRALLKYV